MKNRKYIDARSAAAGDDSTGSQTPPAAARRPGRRPTAGSVHQHTSEGRKLANEALMASKHFGYPPTQPAQGMTYDIGIDHFQCVLNEDNYGDAGLLPFYLTQGHYLFAQVALLQRPSPLAISLGYVSARDLKKIELEHPFQIHGSPDDDAILMDRHSYRLASVSLDRDAIGREGRYGFEGLTLGISFYAQRGSDEPKHHIGSAAIFFPKDYRKKKLYLNFG